MTSMSGLSVTASNPRPTATGAKGRHGEGVDVDVTVTLGDGRTVRGEVTLLPAEDGRPTYEAWGTSENWVSGALLAELYAEAGREQNTRETFAAMLTTMEREASAAAGAPEVQFVSAPMVRINGVEMTQAAAEVAQWAGIDPAEDVTRLRNGQVTEAALAAECEDGAEEPETIEAWREYVRAVALAAEVPDFSLRQTVRTTVAADETAPRSGDMAERNRHRSGR